MGGDISDGAKIGIGLVLLVAIVAIVMALLKMVKNQTNSGSTKLQDSFDKVAESEFDGYDQVENDKAIAQSKKTQAYYEKAQEATWAKYNNTDVLGFDVRQMIESTKDGKTGVIVTTERQLNKGLSESGGHRISGFAYGGKVADGDILLDGKTIGYTTSDLTITDGYITVNGADAKNISVATDSTSCAYIPTNTKFHSTLLTDNTGNIIGVYFKEV